MIALLLGGARSGKSTVAERLAASLSGSVTYLATATVDHEDREFVRRVEQHRLRRPDSWVTIETGADLSHALVGVGGVALVDSLGTWVAVHREFRTDTDALIAALVERDGDTILVSEEVGLGVSPSTALGGHFRDALGTVNQRVAEVADQVWLVVAGRTVPLDRTPW